MATEKSIAEALEYSLTVTENVFYQLSIIRFANWLIKQRRIKTHLFILLT